MRPLAPLALAVLAGCVPPIPTPTPEPSLPDGVFRVVLMADSHVIGPQYTEPSENGDLDNDSILQTVQRLEAAVAHINAIRPRPAYVFLLGDVLHDAYHSHDPAWYEQNRNAFTVAAEVLSGLEVPLSIAWGNHDYEVNCGRPDDSWDRAFSHALFDRFFQAPPYEAVDLHDWRFLTLNSMLGPSWEVSSDRCQTGDASYGPEQLQWLEEQLAAGKPSVALFHYALAFGITMREEDDGPNPDLPTVLGRHPNLKHAFVGHTHRWIDLGDSRGYGHTIVASTRYDADNFWLVEFRPDGSYEVLDEAKARFLTTCADTWSYDGTPAPVDGAIEEGTCGS